MKIHRFIGPYALGQKSLTIGDARLAKQLRSVLRLKIGEVIMLCDGAGHEARGVIQGYGKDSVSLELDTPNDVVTESSRHLALYCSILKRENFELVVQKATECGVATIIPLLTARTVKQSLKLERLRSIAQEAAEQSGRGVVPTIATPVSFEDACALAQAHQQTFFFDIDAPQLTVLSPDIQSTGLFIGPEGGWTDEERAIAMRWDMTLASLGTRTLRGETAAIIATFLAARTE